MKKKIMLCILGIVIVLIIGGDYMHNIYSSVTDTLSSVHKPLDRDKSDKRNEKVDIVDQNLFRF